jgi:hypothetical protein
MWPLEDIIYAVVWLVAIAATWDMVRMATKAQRDRVTGDRLDALEQRVSQQNAGERLAKLELGVKTLHATQNAPTKRKWGE